MNILEEEFRQAMVLSGCASVADISANRHLVLHQSYYTKPITSKL